MAQVTFDTTVGGDGSTVSDDNSATTGLGNGGHRTRFVPALAQIVAIASWIRTTALAVAASAASAVATPNTNATSTTSLAVGLGNKSLTVQTGKTLVVGMSVKIASSATPTTWMHGDVTAYDTNTGDLTVNVKTVSGSGTLASWVVSVSGPISDNSLAVVPVAALDIDVSTGAYFTKTINGASAFTFSGAPATRVASFTLEVTHTSGAITWPASVKWPSDVAPTLTTGKTHLFTFISDDGGTTWRGTAVANYTN